MAAKRDTPGAPAAPQPVEPSNPPLRPSDAIRAMSPSVFIPEQRGANPEFDPPGYQRKKRGFLKRFK